MTRSFALLPLLFASALSAQVKMPATTRVGLDELAKKARVLTDPAALTAATQGYYPTALVHGRCMVGFLGQADGPLTAEGVEDGTVMIGAHKGTVVSFRIDARHLDALEHLSGLRYAELAGKVAPTLDKLVKATHADSVQQGIWLPQTYTGRNVLIGITDWGFDYTNPMFYDTAMTQTRIRAAWDQFRQAGPGPSAYNYGTELTTIPELMAAQADTANVYSYALHGTHVAGICGGGGAGTIYRGVAFDAHYLMCTFLVDGAAVLDAFQWMQDIAQQDQKRLVINMSWGLYYMGTLDGHSLLSQAIDQFSQEGVVFANSAGNNGSENFHIKKDFAGDTLRTRIGIDDFTGNPNLWGESISMWGTPGQPFSAGLIVTDNANQPLFNSPWYSTATQQAYLDTFVVLGTDTVFYNLSCDAAHPLNGRPDFRLRVRSTSAAIHAALKATAPGGRVHFWNVAELTNGVGNWGLPFTAAASGWTAGDHDYGIGEPAVTESLISVAAYNSEYWLGQSLQGGNICGFSSYGPTMDERMKPDITAPGGNVASSISSFTDNDYPTPVATVDFNSRTYPFARLSGTSMSSPAVAGIVALILEADPTLTPAEVKDLIKTTARTDSNTGTIPPGGSTRWGAGKINAYQAVVHALGVMDVPEHAQAQLAVWPDPTTAEVNIVAPFTQGTVQLTVLDVTGRPVLKRTGPAAPLLTLDARMLPSGLYLVQLEQDGRKAIARVVKE